MTLRSRFLAAVLLALSFAPAGASAPPTPAPSVPPVLVATIAAPITPVTADYLASVIELAEKEKAALLVVELDTPGGLDTAMRQMVQ
ncbi:MAG: putative rane-bound serine protease (Clpp class), family, partial [Deltaproteobacteria bacterium]|nr:putative rane-bound serine protease (Clpp class), family [Deltaproteobacteria bacterium]